MQKQASAAAPAVGAAPEVPEAALIARALLTDDRHAFGELVKRNQSALRAMLRKLTRGNPEHADDLAQETFILAYRNLGNFRGEAKFATWLYRIAYNVFVSDTRKRREQQLEEDAGAEPETAAESQHTDLRLDLERAMRVLSEAERAAIVQCYFNDLTHEEAAYVLGWPLGTVKTHILKAKQKLKAELG
jgi:RNA polymerase sigma factor (sigma-70 family)